MVTCPGEVDASIERIMWLRREVSGPYLASGDLLSWRRVQGYCPEFSQRSKS